MEHGKFDIRKAVTNSILATDDPTASIKLQNGHQAATQLVKMLVPMGNHDEVTKIFARLTKDFTDEEFDKANPNLVIALCGMLSEALIRLGKSFGH